MASQEDQNVYGEEDVEEDDEDESHDDDPVDEDDDDDVVDEDEDDDSISSAAAGEVTIAVAGTPNPNPAVAVTAAPDPTAPAQTSVADLANIKEEDAVMMIEKKPLPLPDESRRLFQRLWTDEDEIELLQGFLEYTTQRGTNYSASHHHDTTAFYDQIKNKLQLDFNKNQLVEKLRRLKKKYRNVLSKISAGKEVVFKSPHDQATYEISCKIWSGITAGNSSAVAGLDDEDANPIPNLNLNDHSYNGVAAGAIDHPNSAEKKSSRSRKRSRAGTGTVKIEEKSPLPFSQQCDQPGTSIPNLVEETVKSCLLPLFKEVLNNAVNVPCGSRGLGAMNLNMLPMGLGGSMNFTGGDITDEKWRKQHILELEVYSKRLQLLQDQIKSQLEELKSLGNS